MPKSPAEYLEAEFTSLTTSYRPPFPTLDRTLIASLPPQLRAKAKEAQADIHRCMGDGRLIDAKQIAQAAAQVIANGLPDEWLQPEPESADPAAMAARVPRYY